MPITEKTVYVTSDGIQYDDREEAERRDRQAAIAKALSRLYNEEGDLILEDGECDELAWNAKELLAILKKHLEPDQQRFAPIEAPIDEAKARDALLYRSQHMGSSVWTAAMLVAHRSEVVMILQGIERPEPLHEQDAILKLANIVSTGANDVDRGEALFRKRDKVIAILQAVR